MKLILLACLIFTGCADRSLYATMLKECNPIYDYRLGFSFAQMTHLKYKVKTSLVDTFSIKELKEIGGKSINLRNYSASNDSKPEESDFQILQDIKHIYILSTKTSKLLFVRSRHGLLDIASLYMDTNNRLTITFRVTALPRKGDRPFRPGPPLDRTYEYKGGLFVKASSR